jgi:hypothetical protein
MLVSACIAATLTISAVGLAAQEPEQRLPWIATGLGPVAVEACLILPSFGFNFPFSVPYSPFSALPTLAPIGFGLGQAYLGDYPKAAAIAIGAPIAIMGSAIAAQGVYDLLNPCTNFTCAGSTNLNTFSYTWVGMGLAVGAWTSWDAYCTAEKLKRKDAIH